LESGDFLLGIWGHFILLFGVTTGQKSNLTEHWEFWYKSLVKFLVKAITNHGYGYVDVEDKRNAY